MDLTRRQFIWITLVIPLLGVLYLIAFDYTPSPPTPLEARAAMAEVGACKPDAPIVERDGKVFIDGYEFFGWAYTNPPDDKRPLRSGYGNFSFQRTRWWWPRSGRWKTSASFT